MRNVADKILEKSKHTFDSQKLVSENLADYEIMSKKYGGDKGVADNMAHALCVLDK
jgi:hypothetical protein